MNPAFIVLAILFLISAALSLMLAIAWRNFGRPPHALQWSIGFGVSAGQWAANLVGVLFLRSAVYYPIVMTFVLASMGLLYAGFRSRAGLPLRPDVPIAAGVVALATVAFGAIFYPLPLLTSAPIQFYGSLMLGLSVATFYARGARPTGAHKAVVTMLALFALFSLADGVIAAFTGLPASSAASAPPQLYRVLLLFGLPAGWIGTGLFCVFLLAIDLADEMRRLAARDPLTGVLNRRGFEAAAQGPVATSRRHGLPLSVAIADLDRFKTVNDRFGHAAGDLALQRFTACIEEALRRGDLFGRLGGEEFAFVMPNTDARQAAEAMERMRCRVAESAGEGDVPFGVTASFGVAAMGIGDIDLAAVLSRADAALYQSKLAGRNRVTLADAAPTLLLREVSAAA